MICAVRSTEPSYLNSISGMCSRKPAYLLADGTGYLTRVADNIESVQLGMASDLLDHAADMLADDKATPAQLRFLLARMRESLTDVHRVAKSRDTRLPEPAYDDEIA